MKEFLQKNFNKIILLFIFILLFILFLIFCDKFKTYIISNHINLLKILSPTLIAFLVYKYTTDNHKKTLLNELDSKSEWRKTLFEIAGLSEIKTDNLYQLRAALRFTYKDENDYYKLKYFDCMNIIIIKYCENLISQKRIEVNQNENEEKSNLENYEMDTIRLFCIYMLADHWEKNQNKNFTFNNPKKEIELCIDTLQKFLNVNDKNHCYNSYKTVKTEDNFYCLYHQSIEFINTMTP
ncbi:hypothetical protein [Staphylococcus sp. GDH8C109P]|uniref:hypothetical protein n=1 Tax=Staphylococcus sp. GDH8C109P TaxID=2804088 RepID=UPI001AEBB31F|nr:hypothetical protein [Staphylococcus sp. GDH8C109P]